MSTPDAVPPVARRARRDEAERMAALLTDALGEKFRPALGRGTGRRLGRIIDAEIADGDHYYVVADAQGITGVAHLDLGADGSASTVRTMAQAIGWPRTIRAVATWSLIEDGRRQPDEAYVDELAVADRARRKGVGQALLAACEADAREAGLSWVRLIVVWENEGAIALYRKAGYRIAARRRWYLGRLVFGSQGAFLMEKHLSQPEGAAPPR